MMGHHTTAYKTWLKEFARTSSTLAITISAQIKSFSDFRFGLCFVFCICICNCIFSSTSAIARSAQIKIFPGFPFDMQPPHTQKLVSSLFSRWPWHAGDWRVGIFLRAAFCNNLLFFWQLFITSLHILLAYRYIVSVLFSRWPWHGTKWQASRNGCQSHFWI